jgi:hypothetical protein
MRSLFTLIGVSLVFCGLIRSIATRSIRLMVYHRMTSSAPISITFSKER